MLMCVETVVCAFQLVNKEMFWVVTEVCNELNVVKRMKIIKQFIKIARKTIMLKGYNCKMLYLEA